MCLQVSGSLIDSLYRDLVFFIHSASLFLLLGSLTYLAVTRLEAADLYSQRMLYSSFALTLPSSSVTGSGVIFVCGLSPAFPMLCLHHELSHFVVFLFPVVDFSFLPGQIPEHLL